MTQQIKIKETHFITKIDKKEKEELLSYASWAKNPPIKIHGRSTIIKNYKIKGCGNFDLNKGTASMPQSQSYDPHINKEQKSLHYQIQITEDGKFIYQVPSKKPLGAQTLENAKNEITNTEILYKKNPQNFYTPIAYGEYKDLEFNDKPLGFSILELPESKELTLADYFKAIFQDAQLFINNDIINLTKKDIPEPKIIDVLRKLKELVNKHGETLQKLHQDFVDYDSHFYNATINPENQETILFDLDNIKQKSKLPELQSFNYQVKDIYLGIQSLMSTILLNGVCDSFEQFGFHENYLESWLSGYFKELNPEVKSYSDELWEKTLELLPNMITPIPLEQRLLPISMFLEKELDPFLELLYKNLNPPKDYSYQDHQKNIQELIKQRQEIKNS